MQSIILPAIIASLILTHHETHASGGMPIAASRPKPASTVIDSGPAVPPGPPAPTADECLTPGFFCFEVTKGPRYGYRIHPDEEKVLFAVWASRVDNNTFNWNMSLHESIDWATASLLFLPNDGNDVEGSGDSSSESSSSSSSSASSSSSTQPALKLEVNKMEDQRITFQCYEWSDEKGGWSYVTKNRNKELNLFSKPISEMHSVRFTSYPMFDKLLGLEDRNLTIGISMKTELVWGEVSNEAIDFSTQDGHYFMRDKPEIREFREKRRIARQMEKAAMSNAIIISLSILGIIVVTAIVIAIFLISRSVAKKEGGRSRVRASENGTAASSSSCFAWKRSNKDQKDPDHSPPQQDDED